MQILKLMVAMWLTTLATSAYANVIYRWESIQTDSSAPFAGSYLAVSDAAYLFGSVNSSGDAIPYTYQKVAYFGVDEFNFPSGMKPKAYTNCTIDCGSLDPSDLYFASVYHYSFQLTFSDILSGSISIDTPNDNLRMSGGPIWTFSEWNSDGPYCYTHPEGPNGCTQNVGKWVLDKSTVPVPEPATLSLVGLAAVGFIWRRKMG